MTSARMVLASLVLGGGAVAVAAAGCSGDGGGATEFSVDAAGDVAQVMPSDAGGDATLGAYADAGDADAALAQLWDADAADAADVAPTDAGGDADAALASPPLAKIVFVHASPDAPAVRICLGFGDPSDGGTTTIQPVVPAPNTSAGMAPGFGGPQPKPPVSMADKDVTFYAIPAAAIAGVFPGDAGTEKTCRDLLGPSLSDGSGAGVPDGGTQAYAKLGTIPAGTLKDGTSWVLALVGCLAGNPAGASTCGPNYAATKGNLRAAAWQVDNLSRVPGDRIGAQFIQASSAYDGIFGEVLGSFSTTAGFRAPDATDASVITAIETSARFGAVAPANLVTLPGVTFDGTSSFFAVPVTDAGPAGAAAFAQPLPVIQTLSWPSGAPQAATFQNGEGYAFILLGNPSSTPTYIDPVDGGASTPDAGGVFNARALHFLAFPTDPPLPASP